MSSGNWPRGAGSRTPRWRPSPRILLQPGAPLQLGMPPQSRPQAQGKCGQLWSAQACGPPLHSRSSPESSLPFLLCLGSPCPRASPIVITPAPERRRELGRLHASARFVLGRPRDMVKSSFTGEEVEAQKGEVFLTKATQLQSGRGRAATQRCPARNCATRQDRVPLREAPGHAGRPECHLGVSPQGRL